MFTLALIYATGVGVTWLNEYVRHHGTPVPLTWWEQLSYALSWPVGFWRLWKIYRRK